MERILADMDADKEFLSVSIMACSLPLVQHRLLRAGARPDHQRKSMMISITLGRTPLVAVQAKSLRSHALYLVIKGIHVLSALRAPRFRRIGLTQFFQRFFDREFGCFGHGNLISKRNAFSLLATSQGRRLPAERTRRHETISAGREACLQCFRSGAGVR
jgi:hypothetical protein